MTFKKDFNHSESEENNYFKEVSPPISIDLGHIFDGYVEFVFDTDFNPGVQFSADIKLFNSVVKIAGDVIHKSMVNGKYIIRVKINHVPEVFLKEMEHLMSYTSYYIN